MGGPEDTPEPASQVRDSGKGTYEQQKAPDTTDDAWQRGMTPMVALRYEEDASDAPTVIGGEVEEMPNLDDLFPVGGRKKVAPEVVEAPLAAPVASAPPAAPTPEPAPKAAPVKAAPAKATVETGGPALGYGLVALGVLGVIGLILAFVFGG